MVIEAYFNNKYQINSCMYKYRNIVEAFETFLFMDYHVSLAGEKDQIVYRVHNLRNYRCQYSQLTFNPLYILLFITNEMFSCSRNEHIIADLTK